MKFHTYFFSFGLLLMTVHTVYGQYSSFYKQHLRDYPNQQAVYLDASYKEVASKENAKYLAIQHFDSLSKLEGDRVIFQLDSTLFEFRQYTSGSLNGNFVRFYPSSQTAEIKGKYAEGQKIGIWRYSYINEIPQEEHLYSDEPNKDIKGVFNYLIWNAWDSTGKQNVSEGNGYYYSNRDLSFKEDYHTEGRVVEGLREGIWKCVNTKGQLYYEENYRAGQLLKGFSFDKDGKRYEYDTEIEQSAAPKNGFPAFYQELVRFIEYPKSARRAGIEGKVYLQVIIDQEGKLGNIKILKGISPECDEEAVKALSMVTDWNPGKQRGQPVKQSMIVPVIFKLSN